MRRGCWIYSDTGETLKARPCRSCNRAQVIVRVKIPADLSCTGKTKWKKIGIDACIAPIVKALQKAGIDMRGSCCGHGKEHGDIHLQDGRVLIIQNNAQDYYVNRKPPKSKSAFGITEKGGVNARQ
jgi:hypothetical protein